MAACDLTMRMTMTLLLMAGLSGCGSEVERGSTGTGGRPEGVEGTGGSPETGGGGGGTGGEDAPEPTLAGDVHVIRAWYAQDENDPAIASAGVFLGSFDGAARPPYRPEDHGCSVFVVDGCDVRVCPRPLRPSSPGDPIPLVDAGPIHVEGLTQPLTVRFGEDFEEGAYNVDIDGPPTVGWPFASGAPLVVRSEGSVVPAFTAALDAPARLRVTAPELASTMTLDRSSPLQVEWSSEDGSGVVHVTLDDQRYDGEQDQDVSILCKADVSAGAFAVPVEALERLSPGGGGSLFIVSQTTTDVVAGDWRVSTYVTDMNVVFGGVEIQ